MLEQGISGIGAHTVKIGAPHSTVSLVSRCALIFFIRISEILAISWKLSNTCTKKKTISKEKEASSCGALTLCVNLLKLRKLG